MTSTTRNNDPALRQTNSNVDDDDDDDNDDDPWVLTDGGGIDQEKRPELYQFNIFQENEDDDDDIVLVFFPFSTHTQQHTNTRSIGKRKGKIFHPYAVFLFASYNIHLQQQNQERRSMHVLVQ